MKVLPFIAAAAFALFAALAPSKRTQAATCPAIGVTTDCGIIVTLNPDGTATIADTGQGPYDGSDDTLVGIVNNSTSPLTSLGLTGSDIFGFDGDGICTFSFTGDGYCPGAPTGYEGPTSTFTATDPDTGFVNFTPALAVGASTYFSLEEALTAASLSVTGVNTGSAPEPASLFLLGPGLLGILRLRRRRHA